MERTEAATRRRKFRWHKLVGGLLLFGLGWFVVAWIAARALIIQTDLADADAIVILSGSSTYIERTQKAAELYQQGRAKLIVLTDDHTRGGWSSVLQTNPFFVERAKDELVKRGVPSANIRVAPGIASSTHEEAVIIREYSLAQGFRSILVVTSAYHSRRAVHSLRQSLSATGISVSSSPAPIGNQTPTPALWWLYVEGWRSVGGEYVKLVYYWLKYG